MSVSENIKKLRKQRGWSQARLAIEANVSQQAISFIERERNEPSAEMIRALAKAFHVSMSEIMEDQPAQETSLSDLEAQLIAVFRQLNRAGKSFLLQQADSILQQPAFREEGSIYSARGAFKAGGLVE